MYTKRCIKAQSKSVVFWPNSFCVGFVNGMLFPLEKKPKMDGEDFYSRKKITPFLQPLCVTIGSISGIYLLVWLDLATISGFWITAR